MAERYRPEDWDGAERLLQELGRGGAREDRAWLDAALRCLSERERHILTARYGLAGDPPLSYRHIAGALGLTPQRVQQVAARALDKLRELGQARERAHEVGVLWTLPAQTRNALQRAGYTRPEQIAQAADHELLSIPRLGRAGLRAVRQAFPHDSGQERSPLQGGYAGR